MAEEPGQNPSSNHAFIKLKDVFSLHHDQAHPDKIDTAIRANTRVSGTNMWVLMFAIAVASIGLNVNSTAVIIGAMLISPLMGPIVGMGYGAAVGDMGLIRLALRNIAVFVAISLFTATLYFLVTPLQEAQSELLARTHPTLWDVLIAFFGGSAGIVAITRKEAGNAIPGVAIATALMPPLCTAGFGLAHGNWQYFFGAFYLFAINCVFIAFSTLFFAKLLKLPRRGMVTGSKRRLLRIVITTVILAVMLPSSYLAVRLVQEELFTTTATNAVKEIRQQEGFVVLRSAANQSEKSVGLVVSGSGNAEHLSMLLTKKLEELGVKNPKVNIIYAGGNANLDQGQQELVAGKNNPLQIDSRLKEQQDYIDTLLAKQAEGAEDAAVLKEIQAQFPEAQKIIVGRGLVWEKAAIQTASASEASAAEVTASPAAPSGKATAVWLDIPAGLTEIERKRLQAWLAQRLNNPSVQLLVNTGKVGSE